MRTYQIQKIGGSYYLALPPSIVSKVMLKLGVNIEVMHYDGYTLVLLIKVSPSGKHTENNKKSGENTP